MGVSIAEVKGTWGRKEEQPQMDSKGRGVAGGAMGGGGAQGSGLMFVFCS